MAPAHKAYHISSPSAVSSSRVTQVEREPRRAAAPLPQYTQIRGGLPEVIEGQSFKTRKLTQRVDQAVVLAPFRTLREALVGLPHAFKTHCDALARYNIPWDTQPPHQGRTHQGSMPCDDCITAIQLALVGPSTLPARSLADSLVWSLGCMGELAAQGKFCAKHLDMSHLQAYFRLRETYDSRPTDVAASPCETRPQESRKRSMES